MKGYAADKLDEALDGVKVVVIPAGVPRKVCAFCFGPIDNTDIYYCSLV